MGESPSVPEKAACFHPPTHTPAHPSRASPADLREPLFLQGSSSSFPLSQQRQTARFASRCNNQSAFRESQERKHLHSSCWGLKTLAPKMKAARTKKRFQSFIQLNRDIRVCVSLHNKQQKMISLPVNGSAHGSLLWLSHKCLSRFLAITAGQSDSCLPFMAKLGNLEKEAKSSFGRRGSFIAVCLGKASVALLFLNCIMQHF